MTFFLCFLSIFLSIIININNLYTLDQNKTMSQYIHTIYQIEEGLPQNSIQNILQAKDGYIWFGTEEGLVRYDGLNFTIFDKYNTTEIKHNSIYSLCEDKNGVLWIGTDGGGISQYKNRKFNKYLTDESLSSDMIRCIYEDKNGVLWIGTDGGGISRSEGSKLTNYSMKDGLSDNTIYSIYEDSKGVLWIGTNNGLNQYKDGKFIQFTSQNGLSNNIIRCISENKSGALLLGTDGGGLNIYQDGLFTNYTTKDGLSSDMIRSIYEDNNGVLWLGTNGGGINRLQNGKFTHYTTKDGLSNDMIRCIYEDKSGLLWIGTYGGGLNRFQDGKFTHYTTKDGLSNDVVRSIYEDRSGVLWLGTNSGGLNRLKDGKFTYYSTKNGLSNDIVRSIYEDRSGALWIGTRGGGLNRLKDGKFTYYSTKNGLSNDTIFSIYEDRSGALWIGTNGGGLNRLKDDKFTRYSTKDGLSNDIIFNIYEDRSGVLWIGTYGGGLNSFKDGKFTHYTTQEGLSHNIVFSIHEDRNGVLWIGTYGGGLNKLTNGKLTHYTTNEGLFDDTIFWIQEDNNNNLWMTCNRGIFRVNVNEFVKNEIDKSYKISCISYGLADGMLTKECNGGTTPAGWMRIEENEDVNSGGVRNYAGQIGKVRRLYFPTIKGIEFIDPDNIKMNNIIPPIHLEYFLVNNQQINIDSIEKDEFGRMIFDYEYNNINFKYTACSFDYPKAMKFQYMLVGYDEGWKYASYDLRFKEYTNLSSGEYTFRVKACNNDGLWNEEGFKISFVIKPAYYQTFWFISLILILFLSIGYIIIKFRIAKYKRQNKILFEAKQKAEEINKIKSELLNNVSHELITPLSGIMGYSELMIISDFSRDEANSMLSQIHSLGEQLLKLVRDIISFSHPDSSYTQSVNTTFKISDLFGEIKLRFFTQFEEKKLTFIINIEASFPEEIKADYNKLKRIIINLIENAIKFTNNGLIELGVTIDFLGGEKCYLFYVRDTGIGIPKNKLEQIFNPFFQVDSTVTRKYGGTGLGLAITKKLVTILKGDIWVESDVGIGSTFFFFIKIE